MIPGDLDEQLRSIIAAREIGLVGVDPFIKTHEAEENDNAAIDRVATRFAQIGYEYDCTTDYIHHHRTRTRRRR
jgi:hypothetical protein